MTISTMGLDLAKSVFQVHAVDRDEFNDIQPALPAFILGDKGLRAIEPFGNIGLRELPGFPDFG